MTLTPKFCEQCGAGLIPGSRFCESCGKSIIPENAAPAAPSPIPIGAACPRCGQPGMTAARVIATYEAIPKKEKATENEADGEIARGLAVNELSKPEKPQPPSIKTWLVLLLIPVVNLFSVFFSPLVRGLKLFISAVTLAFMGLIIWYASGAALYPYRAETSVYLAGLVWLGLYLFSLLFSKQAAMSKMGEKTANYERALSRWDHLHYCEKCDVVYFDDGPGRSAPIGETKAFLVS